jgi:hypothetical protein
MFEEAVDPERDEAPDYLTIIKHPMDLTTVEQKLGKNEYKNIHEWKEDVQLIFHNAVTYNGKASTIAEMASDLEHIFLDLTKTLFDDDSATWVSELTVLRKELCDHMNSGSRTCIGSFSD